MISSFQRMETNISKHKKQKNNNNTVATNQVDEDLGVSERAAAAVTGDHALSNHDGRHLGDQVDGELRVHLLRAVGETYHAVVSLLERLSEGGGGEVREWGGEG